MTFAFKGSGGASSSSNLNQFSTPMTTTTTAGAVGDLAILAYAVDNNAITDGFENAVLSVTTPDRNVWIRATEFTNGQAAIQAGATCGIWFCNLLSPLPIGSVITVNFGDPPARDASAFSLAYFTEALNFTGVVEATASLANDAQSAGSLNATTTSIACLRIRATASESNSTVAWTKTAAFTGLLPQAVTNSGGGAVNQGIRGEYCISTGTGQASLPTGGAGGATDHASVYVAWREVPTQFLTPALYDDVATFYTSLLTLFASPTRMTDSDTIPAPIIKTINYLSSLDVHDDGDILGTHDVLRGAITLTVRIIMDIDDIFDVAVVPNAPAQIGWYEDEDIIHRPELSTFWIIVEDVYVDADDIATAIISYANTITHHVVSFDEFIEPGVVSYSEATSSDFEQDDHFFGSNSLNTSGAGPGFQDSDDQFFISTFIADLSVTAAFVTDTDATYAPTVIDYGVNQAVIPPRYSDADIIHTTTAVHFPAPHLQPIAYADTDAIRAPMLARGTIVLMPPRLIDSDHFTPPFIGRRRYVRSGVGVLKGTIDTISLVGNRDEDIAA